MSRSRAGLFGLAEGYRRLGNGDKARGFSSHPGQDHRWAKMLIR
jgi:hypothetical protein